MRFLALGLAVLFSAGMLGCGGSAQVVTPTSTVNFDPEKDKTAMGFGQTPGGEQKKSGKPGFAPKK